MGRILGFGGIMKSLRQWLSAGILAGILFSGASLGADAPKDQIGRAHV
jgi:hypothetical protein